MLAEFVKAIVGLAKDSTEVKTIPIPGNLTLVRFPDGTVEKVENDPKLYRDSILSLGSLIDWIGTGTNTHVMVSSNKVVATRNRSNATLMEIAVFNLLPTKAFACLNDWERNPCGQKVVVRNLRTTLDGTFDPKYLAIFRRIDFRRKTETTGVVGRAGESMGRSVEMSAQSVDGELPEVMDFSTPIFDGLAFPPEPLRYAIEVDVPNESIAIFSVGDTIADAIRSTRSELVERLKSYAPEALVFECE